MFARLAQDMHDHLMRLLNGGAVHAFNHKRVGEVRQGWTAVAAKKPQCGNVQALGYFQNAQQVGAFATGGKHNQQITGASKRLELAREHLFKAKLIGNTCQRGWVGAQ